jgi:hypothetical protein
MVFSIFMLETENRLDIKGEKGFVWKPGLRPRHPDDIGFSLLPHVLGPGYE